MRVLTAQAGASARRSRWLALGGDVVLAVGLLVALAGFLLAVLTARVEGVSMAPTLRSGDLVLVDRLPIVQPPPRRGDIVVLHTGGAIGNTIAIKRVIGLPGDQLEIDAGRVLIRPGGAGDWQLLSEPYAPGRWTVNAFCCDDSGRATVTGAPHAVTIPAGTYFVLGDNRNDSTDSRVFGLVQADLIQGRAIARYWPLGRAGSLRPGPQLTPSG